MRVLVDGQAGGCVDPLDRGLQYGDGLFETIAVPGSRPRFLDWHLERLADGTRRLGFPALDTGLLRREVEAIANGSRCIVKLVVTRGSGPRGYRPPQAPQTRRIVAASDWPQRTAAAGARDDATREVLIAQRPPRVDVAEEDAVHGVVEQHVEPLDGGHPRNFAHA